MSSQGQRHERAFEAISAGRGAELIELLMYDRTDQEIDALLELVSGLTDELGDPERHHAALVVMKHAHAMRGDDWFDRVMHLQRSGPGAADTHCEA